MVSQPRYGCFCDLLGTISHPRRLFTPIAGLPCTTVMTFFLAALLTPLAIDVWPLPHAITSGSISIAVIPSATFFALDDAHSPLLNAAFERYMLLTFPHEVGSADGGTGGLSGLSVAVRDLDESHPTLEIDESYELSVTAAAATLKAKTVFGALRGLETFSQLVEFDFTSEAYTIPNAPLSIHDAPRFPHRGLMIDTSRHFQPLASIRAIIDSLPYAKLNVLHWHVVDKQSFPLRSESNPKLWDGAYDLHSRYTHADVRSIVEYARLRGVRVFPEFDTPGHADSWCVGYPELCPSAECRTPLDVTRNGTFALIDRLFAECTGRRTSRRGDPAGLFPNAFLHLGGDEVNTRCWTWTPRIREWLKAHSMTADDGYAFFTKRVAAIAIAQGRRPIQWSEVYDHFKTALPKQVIVHVWKSVTNVTEVVASGYDVLRNVGYNNVSWYLDNLNVPWDHVYANDPCDGVPDSLCHKILGGHGEMWGETVDASDLQQTVWPRLGAIAEKLWSARADTHNTADAAARMHTFRCRLNERGVAAAPVGNANARSAPPHPGACLQQRRRLLARSEMS